MKTDKAAKNQEIAYRVSINTMAVNLVLSAFKLFAGIFASSSAMISDSVHSFSDVFSTVVVMIGIKISGKASDKDHPYGHERLECAAALILAVMLFAVGVGIGRSAIQKLIDGNSGIEKPGVLALIAAIVSIVVKEAMYWYTVAAAKKTDSGALKADAWHHRSDALSSIGSLIGVGGAMLGLRILDPLASAIICIFIFKVAFDIFKDAIAKMTDKACDDKIVEAMRLATAAQELVRNVDRIDTRMFGNKIYVDIEISVDGDIPLSEAHEIAQRVHDEIEFKFPKVKHCMVHVNPYSKEEIY